MLFIHLNRKIMIDYFKILEFNDLENEKWCLIPNTNEKHYVSNLGRIKRIKTSWRYGSILKQTITKKGYLRVSIYINGIRKSLLTHRIVSMVFINNDENKPQVNHKNGIKTDNRVENLEWCTNGENQIHAYKIGLNKSTGHRKGITGALNLTSKPIIQCDMDGNELKKWDSYTIAAKALGFSYTGLSRVISGEYKQYKGFKWKAA